MAGPVIFNGLFVKTLKSQLNLNDAIYILNGTNDPTSVATNAPEGSIYSRTSTGRLYTKNDAGSTTNWTIIPNSTGSLVWNTVAGTSQAMSANNGYIPNNASLVTLTLPASASVGDTFSVAGKGAGGWQVAQNAGQSIISGSFQTTTGTSGFLSSTQANACVQLVCITQDTTFEVVNFNGSFTTIIGSGYVMGGTTGSVTTSVNAITFTTDTNAAIAATLPTAKSNQTGVSSSLKGYAMGGSNGTTSTNSVAAVTFSGQTIANIGATLATALLQQGAGTYSSTKGYAMGGSDASVTEQSVIQGLTFAGEAISTIGASLTTATRISTGTSSSTKGYMMGGSTSGGTVNTIEALTFAGETVANLGATLTVQIREGAGTQSSLKGYYMGGFNSSSANVTTIEALTFAGETVANLAAVLATAKKQSVGTSSSAKGYCEGGNTGSVSNVIEALTFSGETMATLAATLTSARQEACGAQG